MRWLFERLVLIWLLSATYLWADAEVFPPGATIHPLCFEQLLSGLDSDNPFNPVACDSLPGKYPVHIFPGKDAADLTYTAQRIGSGDYRQGFIAYAVAGHWLSKTDNGEWTLFEVTSANGRGSLLSSIWLLLRPEGSDIVKPLLYVPGGDRCNDGDLSVAEIGADRLVFLSAATPFRLLNPTRQSEWRQFLTQSMGDESAKDSTAPYQGPFLDWKPYLDVANGAGACAGGIIKSYNFKTDSLDVLGVRIDRDAFLSASQGAKQACINEWLQRQSLGRSTGSGNSVQDVELEVWDEMLASLEPACAH